MSWVFGLGILILVVGVAGTVLPVLPGPPFVFLGMLIAAWADGFARIGWPTLAVLGLLTLATVAIDLLSAAWGSQRAQASRQAFFGAAIGSIVGLFFGIPGLILGPFIGAVAGEYVAHRELRRAGKVGLAAWLGMLVGGAARVAIVMAMLAVFVVSYLWI